MMKYLRGNSVLVSVILRYFYVFLTLNTTNPSFIPVHMVTFLNLSKIKKTFYRNLIKHD